MRLVIRPSWLVRRWLLSAGRRLNVGPHRSRDPVQIPDDLPALDGQLALQLPIAGQLAAGRVDEAERAAAHVQHRDVSFRADAQAPEIGPLDDVGRLQRCSP